MASNPCPNKVTCECLDFPIRNFTAEGPEPPFIGINVTRPIPRLNRKWIAAGCIAECDSDISQDDADDCARRQAQFCIFPPDDPEIPRLFCNDPVVGTFLCPDGSTYFFPIAGGVFCDLNLEQANAIAQSTANNRARENHFCLNAPCLSPCVNEPATFTIQIVGGTGPFSIELWSGSVPDGMTIAAGARDLRLSGTPTIAGEQSFALKISDGVGGYLITNTRTLTVHVLQITPETLPAFTQGAAYSQQLGVIGGSGNYAWKIASGSLPDGLTMSITGLISGTPTSGVAKTFSVQVIDLTCEELNKTFFPPRVALVGHSSHAIATIRGYPEFLGFASTPPKKYMVRKWSGEVHHAIETSFIQPAQAEIAVSNPPSSLTLGQPTPVVPFPGYISNPFLPTVLETPAVSGFGTSTSGPTGLETSIANFTVPLVGETVVGNYSPAISQAFGSWGLFGPGNTLVYLLGPNKYATFKVVSVIDSTSANLMFINYPQDVDPGTVIPAGSPVSLGVQFCHAKSTFDGQDEIDLSGTELSRHSEAFRTANPKQTGGFYVMFDVADAGSRLSALNYYFSKGACWARDNVSNEPGFEPSEPLAPANSISAGVFSGGTTLFRASLVTTSGVHAEIIQSGKQFSGYFQNPFFLVDSVEARDQFGNFVVGDVGRDLDGQRCDFRWDHNFTIDLLNEYTDAIASANAQRFVSNGLVAENKPRTTGFVSSFTDVQYELRFSNLVPGVNYSASVSLWASTGVTVVRNYAFTADASTHVIIDNAPTPPAQQTIVVRNAAVRFA